MKRTSPDATYQQYVMALQQQHMRKQKFKTVVYILIGLWIASYLFGNFFAADFRDTLAVIPLEGAIVGFSQDNPFLGGSVNSKTLAKTIESAAEKSHVKAILLEINSPGGTVVASREVVTAVKNVEKPVVAMIREIGTSGAYWVASASDYIITDELSLTGSIGVTAGYLEFGGLMEEYGVGYEELKAGRLKDIGNPYEALSAEERAILEEKLELIHEYFITDVAANRDMDVADVRAFAEGLYYLGVEAQEYGLVDGFGGKQEAKEKAEELAGVEDLHEVVFKESKGLFGLFSGMGLQHSSLFMGGPSLYDLRAQRNSFTPSVVG